MKCIKRLRRCHAVKYEDIAILTPYKAQKELLKRMVKDDDELMSWVNPRIATIVESQGQPQCNLKEHFYRYSNMLVIH